VLVLLLLLHLLQLLLVLFVGVLLPRLPPCCCQLLQGTLLWQQQ
jgi:hypothetical protein